MKVIEGGHDDKPLSGPWNRPDSVKKEVPVSTAKQKDKEVTDSQDWDLPSWEKSSGDAQGAPKSYQDAVLPLTISGLMGESEETEHLPEKTALQDTPGCEKSGGPPCYGFMQRLLTPQGIYSGLVMSEILGARRGAGRGR